MPIILPIDVVDIETLDLGDCTHPAGHCYGSDGGSGIAKELQVAPGRGGIVKAWLLDQTKTVVLQKAIYAQCQYCLKATFVEEEIQGGVIDVSVDS